MTDKPALLARVTVPSLVLLSFSCLQEVQASNYPIVDTHQNNCYTPQNGALSPCSGAGQDADHNGNLPDYTVSNNGTQVTDTVTGLTWTQSTDINGSGTVDRNDKLSWGEAVSYCQNLNLGGLDWRLPTIKEAYSLILFSGEDASNFSGTDTSVLELFLDSRFDRAFGDLGAGERIIDGQYATASLYVGTVMNDIGAMFGVNYVDGRIKGYALNTGVFYVRCVSGNTRYGENDFVDNGDITITDQATNLMWQRDDGASSDWADALTRCEEATTADHDDWRLPNIKELQSIVDYSRSPDTTSSAAIDPLFNASPISNEVGQSDWRYYWSSTTHVEFGGNGARAAYVAFGRAMGYFDPGPGDIQVLDVHGAGAQRSNGKQNFNNHMGAGTADVGYGTFSYHGPQGDILRLDNGVRCVRDAGPVVDGGILQNGFESP